MARNSVMRSSAEIVAQRVAADIKNRGLMSGDRYFTGNQVGQMFNVSSVTANRAMQLLAEQGLLVRQRKSGTFIGEGVEPPSSTLRKRVHLILTSGIWPDDQAATESYSNQLLCGVLDAMPGVSIQADIVGPPEINAFVRQIVDNYTKTGEVAGVVLIRSDSETQRQLADAGVPTVVFGSIFPGLDRLSCVDVDQRQVGCLSAQYLIKAQHSRVLTFMLNQWSPGDNAFISGFFQGLQGSSAAIDMEIQSVPVVNDVCGAMVRSELEQTSRPTAVVVRSPWLARKVAEVAGDLGLSVPDDVNLVIGNHHKVEIGGWRLPGASAVVSMMDCGRKLGSILAGLRENHHAASKQEFVPVRFVEGGKVTRE